MFVEPSIAITGDGSLTLRHPVVGALYRSSHGAVDESRHVFVGQGFRCAEHDPVRVLEAGFGSGLNAWLTLLEAERSARRVEYTAVELYPLRPETVSKLGYTDDDRFLGMHRAAWGCSVEITPFFRLEKRNVDLAHAEFGGPYDVVYFDAFAPDVQPELWSETVFGRIHAAMAVGGVLVTFSAKGTVKRALRAVGFEVVRLAGATGKRHMVRALKKG